MRKGLPSGLEGSVRAGPAGPGWVGWVSQAKGRHGRRDFTGVASGHCAGQLQGHGEAEQAHRHGHRHGVAGIEALLKLGGQLVHAGVVAIPKGEPEPHALGHGDQVEVGWIKAQAPGVGRQGSLGIACGFLALAQAKQGLAVVRLLLEHPQEGGAGQGKLLGLHQQSAQIQQGGDVVAVLAQQLAPELNRFHRALLVAHQGRQSEQEVNVVRLLGQGRAQGRFSAAAILHQQQEAGAVGQGGGVGGIDGEGGLQAGHGLRAAIELVQHQGPRYQGSHMLRVEDKHGVIGG